VVNKPYRCKSGQNNSRMRQTPEPWHQSRNRAVADVVAAGDLPQRLLAPVAARDRLVLLVWCQLWFWGQA
jgi:hypothetical protein